MKMGHSVSIVEWNETLHNYLKSIQQRSPADKLNIGIIGALGCNDVGDEAMLLSMMEQYYRWLPDAKVTVFSMRAEVTNQYINIQSQPTLHRAFYNRHSPISIFVAGIDLIEQMIFKIVRKIIKLPEIWCNGWALRGYLLLRGIYTILQAKRVASDKPVFLSAICRKHIHELREIDVLIFLGGGYINSWHVKARIYPFLVTALIARALGKCVIGSGLNLGPFNAIDRWVVGKIFRRIDLIGLRDSSESFHELQKMQVDMRRVHFSSDDAMQLQSSILEDEALEKLIIRSQPYLAVQAHAWILNTFNQRNLYKLFSQAIDNLIMKLDMNVIMVSMVYGPGTNSDRRTLEKIRNKCSYHDRITILDKELLPQQLKYVFSNANLTICTRHHPLVFSLSSGVPTIAISFDQYYRMKLEGVSQEYSNSCSVFDFDKSSSEQIVLAGVKFLRENFNYDDDYCISH